jgi:hypothetical protein
MAITYDTGALVAADRGERRMWAPHPSAVGAPRGSDCSRARPRAGMAWRRAPSGSPVLAYRFERAAYLPLADRSARGRELWAVGTLDGAHAATEIVGEAWHGVIDGAPCRGVKMRPFLISAFRFMEIERGWVLPSSRAMSVTW